MKFYLMKRLIWGLILTLLIVLPTNQLLAQSDLSQLFFCITPADGQESYIIEFWDSNAFGTLIPENADLRLYSNTAFRGSLYTINTNAVTGGYLTLEELSRFEMVTQVATPNPCLNETTAQIFEGLTYKSVPLPVSFNHAIVVQENRRSELRNPFQRIISFSFGIGKEDDVRHIQLIQNSELDPFLNFRFFDIEPNTPFVVVANKDFGMGQSLPNTVPPEFSRERPSDVRSFVMSDLQDLYDLNLFDVIADAHARIYINSGLIDTYRGTYIRVSLAPDTVERVPPFESGAAVRALPDAVARLVAIGQLDNNPLRINMPYDDNPAGQMRGDTIFRVLRLEEETGQLVIDFDGLQTIVESWLIEVIP